MPETLPELLAALIRINSVNPSLVPGAPGETTLAHFVADWLRGHGIGAAIDEAAPGRPSVIATVPGRGGGRSLLLYAHLDTVGTEHMPAPFDPVIRGGRLYGRGSYDMKGGLAACLLALLGAREAGLRGDVILTAVADEEHASLGMQSVLRRVTADAAIVTEPTSLQLCVAHKGFTWHEVTTYGRAAHGSRPDLGTDAIAHMGRVLGRLEALGRDLASRPAHPLLGHASVHASLIQGGQELSSYPERCTLQVERRTLPGETRESIEAEWNTLLGDLARDPAFHAEHRMTLLRDAFGISEDAPIVRVLHEQAAQILGQPPAHIGMSFWMDAAFLAGAGIPTVVFGPHGAGAHATEEWVDLASAEQCRAVLAATLRDFCA
ncbi:M20/M25/M40 family metallo-hydrolase [Deinococcus apachensis]|uniref:M20/M25/M40 family metallo-hydrolase n=1 Tax=Deinococcus apachensis TaxID=309886 RepID=UPI0003612D85|nr:M20/M25/M40 family metallo-hydrolase [Deinococcus apachensis]